ncbi:hypothetical protein DY037_05665 [Apilactobacillus micheneri]|uniref:hypothetical protein n=1 Tax=Apilactobacillus micheneri TaxID=1899430 RepID=UPI00112702F7|nr:hypothetical protein [Apilactobacillus micheneri]TPR49269.1 hypothetical protein DY037_05665 [Apilactobacillus micheneri]
MRLNTKQKDGLTISAYVIIVLLVVISLLIAFLHVRGEKNQAFKQLHSQQATSKQLKTDYTNKYDKLFDNYRTNITSNKDPKINSLTLNNQNYDNANNTLDKFFNIYFTYNNEKEFNQRKTTLLKDDLITHHFANTSNFIAPKDKSGASYIDGAGLSSSYNDVSVYSNQFSTKADNISVLARVSFASKYRDSWTNYATNIYRVDYNQKNGSVNDITKLTTTNSKSVATNNEDNNENN